MTLGDRILALLSDGHPRTAREIAQELTSTRQEVNQVLREELRGQVRQSANYRWSLASGNEGARPGPDAPDHFLSRLCVYYLECLSLDEDVGYSTFASSRYRLQYAEVTHLSLTGGSPSFEATGEARSLINSVRRSRFRKQLVLGYPIRLRLQRAPSGWMGYFVDPVFVYHVDHRTEGAEGIEPDAYPLVNPAVVRSFAEGGGGRSDVMSEVAALSEELSLGTAGEGPPPLDEMAARLRDLRPEWDWLEDLDPEALSRGDSIADLHEQGIYNRAIILTSERPPFTLGLETELALLRRVQESEYLNTALRYWLGDDRSADSTQAPDPPPLIEILPLNSEQRAAVESALVNPVTVITGPPGTGKSQVVSSILVNCAWHGQKVLFASKNNKAVDVVEERVNSLGPRPVLLRTGSNVHQTKLADYIDSLLSSTTTDEDHVRHRESVRLLDRIEEREGLLREHVSEFMRARNSVDAYDQLAESVRALHSTGFVEFVEGGKADLAGLDTEHDRLSAALRECVRGNASLFGQVLWPFLKGRRLESANTVLKDAGSVLSVPECAPPSDQVTWDNLGRWLDWLGLLSGAFDDLALLRRYGDVFCHLRSLRPLEAVAVDRLKISNEKSTISEEVWGTWLRLQPGRLSPEDRRALSDYVAALRLIISVSANEADRRPIASLIGRLQRLYPQVSSKLNCWAVTSLSARGRVPLEAGFFDLVVFDEASQCDIASAIPLLYRAKRVVVIGDPMQLAHISRITAGQDIQLLAKHELSESPTFTYSRESLYSLGRRAARPISLKDHHRSHADIIGFSNKHFYQGDLRVATRYDRLRTPVAGGPAIRWVDVRGRTRRPSGGSAVNEAEVDAVVQELRRLVVEMKYDGTVGVVTPFRAQADLIRERVVSDDALAPALMKAEFEANTADRFQGDERDVMLFSPVMSTGASEGAVRFLNRERNRFNVAVTRARAALVVVGNKALAQTGDVEYLRNLAAYVDGLGQATADEHAAPQDLGPTYPPTVDREQVSDWEVELYSALYEAGLRTVPQWPVEQYRLDLALFDPANDRKLDIEVDGERFHREWDGELARRDQIRNQRMFELGWDVIRFWVYEVRDDIDGCVEKVRNWLGGMPTISEALAVPIQSQSLAPEASEEYAGSVFSSAAGIADGPRRHLSRTGQMLRRAFEQRRRVRITYTNAEGQTSERTISVYGIGRGYVEAYDSKRRTERTFRIDRISSATQTDESYTVPETYHESGWTTGSRRE